MNLKQLNQANQPHNEKQETSKQLWTCLMPGVSIFFLFLVLLFGGKNGNDALALIYYKIMGQTEKGLRLKDSIQCQEDSIVQLQSFFAQNFASKDADNIKSTRAISAVGSCGDKCVLIATATSTDISLGESSYKEFNNELHLSIENRSSNFSPKKIRCWVANKECKITTPSWLDDHHVFFTISLDSARSESDKSLPFYTEKITQIKVLDIDGVLYTVFLDEQTATQLNKCFKSLHDYETNLYTDWNVYKTISNLY